MRWLGWVLGLLVSVPALAQQGEPSVDGGVVEEAPVTQTVVTASRSVERLQDTPVAVEVITRKDLEATGARDLAEALGARPGLELRRGFAGTELRVQGLSPEYTLVLVDGERVTGRLGGALDFSRFSTEDIEQVEIIRGPSSVLYGSDAVAGVVNIITRKAQRPLGATAQASLGGLWQFEADGSAELRGERAGLRLSGGLQRRDGYDLTPDTPATTGSLLEGFQVSGRGDVRVTEALRLEARAGASRQVQRGVDEGAAGALFDRASQNESQEVTLAPSWVLSPTGSLQLSGRYSRFRHRYVSDQRQSSALDQVEETREQMARVGLQLDQTLAQAHQLVVGVEAIGETLDSDRLSSPGQRGRLSLYGQDSWKTPLPVALHVVPGLRLDVDSEFGTVLTPRLAVRLEPVEALTVRASYGLTFRAPSFQEQLIDFENPSVGYVVAGNPALRPEHSRGATVSAEWRVSSRSLLWTNLFRVLHAEGRHGQRGVAPAGGGGDRARGAAHRPRGRARSALRPGLRRGRHARGGGGGERTPLGRRPLWPAAHRLGISPSRAAFPWVPDHPWSTPRGTAPRRHVVGRPETTADRSCDYGPNSSRRRGSIR